MSVSTVIPSPSSSGSTTPVQGVPASKDERELLGEYRYKLASKMTNFLRFEGLLMELGIDHDEADLRQFIECRDMARKAYDDVQTRVSGDSLVELYNRVNPYESLEYLARTDAERIDAAISDSPFESRVHWINFFRGDILAKLALWYPTITIRKESDEKRWLRRQEIARRRENDDAYRLNKPVWRVASQHLEYEPGDPVYPDVVLRAEKKREQRLEVDRQQRNEREKREREMRESSAIHRDLAELKVSDDDRGRTLSRPPQHGGSAGYGKAERGASPVPGASSSGNVSSAGGRKALPGSRGRGSPLQHGSSGSPGPSCSR